MPEPPPPLGAGALIVVPTYDERDNLPLFLRAVLEVAPGAHVLVVDDASPDGTGAVAEALAAQDPRIRVLHRPSKQGLGTAYVQAFTRGLRVVEVPIVFTDRRAGQSKMSRRIFVEAVGMVWRLRATAAREVQP